LQSATKPRIWFVGHSDGSQLAQLAALKHAAEKGAESVGGVVLFGPSRVGSRGFAAYYNTLLGESTVYYAYGRDPASTTDYTMEQGLLFPGVGLRACPVEGQAAERLVTIPLMGDKMDVCTELKAQDTFISRLWLPDFVFDTSDPMIDHLSNWEYLGGWRGGVGAGC
jgi:pimeloyl-ACP methyl ester carboxylesterase